MKANSGRSNSITRRLVWLVLLLAGLAGLTAWAQEPSDRNIAAVLQIDGAIGPATSSYISDALEEARETGARLVIIEMDTPGGLDASMREIIRAIVAMPVPVVTHVHPSGARAASAGTYILYASHIAAMTPGTNLGAATPVQIGGSPQQPQGQEDNQENQAPAKNAGEQKAVNDAVAYIRSLAEMRGRNGDWAEEAVREAASLSASEALKRNVIDVVAEDRTSLLRQLDGRTVEIQGVSRQLETDGITVVEIEPSWSDRLLATITNPNIALILMMIGVYGLIFEFMNPGALVPGTVGAISLLIGLYALAALPVDFVGLALILLGLALMVGEAFAPSFGILGIGGLASFVIGAAILFDTNVPAFQVSWAVIAALAVFSAGLLILAARVGIMSMREKVRTGGEEMIGAEAQVMDWHDGAGHVFVRSERWNARGPNQLTPGSTVLIRNINGLELQVTAKKEGGAIHP